MTEKWMEEIKKLGKNKMHDLLVPLPSPGALSTRMFDFVDWFTEEALKLANTHHCKVVEGIKEHFNKQKYFYGIDEYEAHEKEITRLKAKNKELKNFETVSSKLCRLLDKTDMEDFVKKAREMLKKEAKND